MAERVDKLTIEIGGRNKATGAFAEVERGLDRIKARLGPRGFLKDITEVAVGGGAVAGLNFFTNTIANGAEKMRDLFDEVRNGKKDVGDVVSETARMLPVLGGAVRFWDAIRESVTGARAEIEKINAEAAANDAKSARMSNRLKVMGGVNPNMSDADKDRAIAELLKPYGMTEDQLRARSNEARVQVRRGNSGVQATRIDTNGNVVPVPNVRIDANGNRITSSADELAKLNVKLKEFEAVLRDINRVRGGSLPGLLGGLRSAASSAFSKASGAASGFFGSLREGFNANSPELIDRAIGGGNLNLASLEFSRQMQALQASRFSMLLAGPGGGGDPLLAGINQTAAARQSAIGSALGMAESALARMQAGRGGGSTFATADTRRGITGVRSIGGGQSDMSAAEKELIKLITELKKEQEKSNKVSDEVKALLGPALRNIEKYLNPDSEL
jgi:hypothetical protein